jgi:hypothetical protein
MSAQKTTARSSAAPRARATGSISGLHDASGKTGFKPWDKGQYALQVVDSDGSKPTRAGDYMLKVKYTILGQPDDINEGRDPVGKAAFCNFVIQPDTPQYEFQVNNLKNYLNAVGIKVADDNSFDHKKAITRKVAVNWGIKKNKQSGLDEQAWNGFVAFDESDYA